MLAKTATLPTSDFALDEFAFLCQHKRLPDIENWIKNWKNRKDLMGVHQPISTAIYNLLTKERLLDANITKLIFYNEDLYQNLPSNLQLNILLTGNIMQSIAAQSSKYAQIKFNHKKRPSILEITAYCDNIKKVVTTLAINQVPNILQDFISSIKIWPAITSVYNPLSEHQMGIASALANQVVNLILTYCSPTSVNNVANSIFYNEALYNQLSHQSLMGLIAKSDHFCVLLSINEPKLERIGAINLIHSILKSNHRFALSNFINSKHLMKLHPHLLAHLLEQLIVSYGITDSSCISYTCLRKINLFFTAIPQEDYVKEKCIAQFVHTIKAFYKTPLLKNVINLKFDFSLINSEYLLALMLHSDEFCEHLIANPHWLNQFDENQIQILFQKRLRYMIRIDNADKIESNKVDFIKKAFMQQASENSSNLFTEMAKLSYNGFDFQDCPPILALIEEKQGQLLIKLKGESITNFKKLTLSLSIFNRIINKKNQTLLFLYLAYSENHFESIYDLILELEKSGENDEDFMLCTHLIEELWQTLLAPNHQAQIMPILEKMYNDNLMHLLQSSVDFFVNNIDKIEDKHQSIIGKNLTSWSVRNDNLNERLEHLSHLKNTLKLCRDQARLTTTLSMIEHQISIAQSMMDVEAIPDFIFATSEPCSPLMTDIDCDDNSVPQFFDKGFLSNFSASLLFGPELSTQEPKDTEEPTRGSRFKKKV